MGGTMRSASRISREREDEPAGGFPGELSREHAALEEKFPGWRIDCIPYADGSVTWKAQPGPVLAAGSAEELAAKINAAHEAAAEWPALANRAEYAVIAPGVTQAAAAP